MYFPSLNFCDIYYVKKNLCSNISCKHCVTFYAQSWGEGNSFFGRVRHHAWYGIWTKKVQNWFYVRTKKIHKWKDKSSQLNLLAHFSSKDNFSKELHVNSVYFYIKHKIKSLKRQLMKTKSKSWFWILESGFLRYSRVLKYISVSVGAWTR